MGRIDAVVVGAGASGMLAAMAAAGSGANVKVLEADSKPLRKVLRTGNGRCNLSNAGIELSGVSEISDPPLSLYRNPGFARHVLERYGCEDVRGIFDDMGLSTYVDLEGRVYPVTNRARSVSDVILNECAALGVDVVLDSEVVMLDPHDGIWTCKTRDGRLFHSRSVVLATGGGAELAVQLGVPTLPVQHVLGPMRTRTSLVKKMSGVRMRCTAGLERDGHEVARFPGEVLFRKYGVSGIVVFDLSRYAREGDALVLDLMPALELDELEGQVAARLERLRSRGDRNPVHAFDGLLVREVADAMLCACGLGSNPDPSDVPADKMARILKGFRLKVSGGTLEDECQVLRGGIEVAAVDPETMAVRGFDGLYACGEAVDVDGACGGYNLHWAWASGMVAGENAVI